MTEYTVTPEEAREAVQAIVHQTGHVLERVTDYSPNVDCFKVEARDINSNKLIEITIYGETVAKVVFAARTMSGQHKGLKRPHEHFEARRTH